MSGRQRAPRGPNWPTNRVKANRSRQGVLGEATWSKRGKTARQKAALPPADRMDEATAWTGASPTPVAVSRPLADKRQTRADATFKGVAIPWRSIPEPASMGLGDHQ